MKKIVECVPNFSEGRDKDTIHSIVKSMQSVENMKVLDVDSGKDTNRTVVTIVGDPMAVLESAFIGIKTASELIDMNKHQGTHPRIGSTDVCPMIPVSEVSDKECINLTKILGKRVGEELKIPIYLYEKSAQHKNRAKLPIIRSGEYEGLAKKLSDPEWKPDFGPNVMHPKAGATVIGCRDFLIAYNINLNTKDTRLATDIAFELRELGRSKRIPNPNSKNLLDGEIIRHDNGKPVKVPGMFKDVKAIGWYVDDFKRAQISINFNNYKKSTIHDVYDKACILAEERGIRVTGSELVGLIPLDAITSAGKYYLQKQNRSIGVPVSDIIECAVQSLGLNDVTPFINNEKIIDYAVMDKNDDMFDKDFLESLSLNTPAPGGGSVSALSGSLGSALCSMVASLTHEKKDMLHNRLIMEEIGVKAQELKDDLAHLVSEDCRAFNKVLDAARLPAISVQDKKEKTKNILLANKYAAEIPYQAAKKCYEVMQLAEILIDKGIPSSLTDAGVASEVAFAGLRGGCMNVLINLPELIDKPYINQKQKEVDNLLKKGEKLNRKLFKKTISSLEMTGQYK